MGDGNSLISLGDLTRPATVLIEKISDAVGAIFLPRQIKRVARAEAEADKIKALTNIEISEMEQRALIRFVREEGRKQENIESITAQAIGDLKEDAKPEDIETDWLVNFFEKCKLVSDIEMQSLWARLLAGEANKPGTFSKRTVAFVSTLEKSDARHFTSLCTFCWDIDEEYAPLVYDKEHEIYQQKGINFSSIIHLDNIGLITFDYLNGFVRTELSKIVDVYYYGTPISIEFQQQNGELRLGQVLLTEIGKELAPLCGSEKSNEFMKYILNEWQKLGYVTWCPIPKVSV